MIYSQVSVTESGNFKDENVVLEIPAPTAIAYGVVELFVKQDAHFGELVALSLLHMANIQVSTAA